MKRRALLLAALCLSACASVAPPGAAPGTPQALGTAPLSASYTGRFSVGYVDQTQSERHVYGNFAWRETGQAVDVELRNPFGNTLAVIHSDARGASLTVPNRPVRRAPDVEALMNDALGFALPVAGLRYWLTAQAAPGKAPAAVRRDAQGRLEHLEQDGWSIDYLGYAGGAAARVTRMNLHRDAGTGSASPLDVRLVLDAPA